MREGVPPVGAAGREGGNSIGFKLELFPFWSPNFLIFEKFLVNENSSKMLTKFDSQ